MKTGIDVPPTIRQGEKWYDDILEFFNEINVVGSRCGPFEPALAALADGSIEVEPLIAARFPLQLAQAALARAGEPGVLKVLIDCSD